MISHIVISFSKMNYNVHVLQKVKDGKSTNGFYNLVSKVACPRDISIRQPLCLLVPIPMTN
jgi:hypothetical protein